jgi:hypothetical protein
VVVFRAGRVHYRAELAARRRGVSGDVLGFHIPFAQRMAKQLAVRNLALTPRCGRTAGPVANLAARFAVTVGQRDRTTPRELSSLGGSEGASASRFGERRRKQLWIRCAATSASCPEPPVEMQAPEEAMQRVWTLTERFRGTLVWLVWMQATPQAVIVGLKYPRANLA